MLQQGIISPVTVPTEWYFGILPVPKPNGCMDLYRPSTTEQSIAARKLSHGFCWREPCHARWKQSIHKIGCQQKLLANSFRWGLKIVDHLCDHLCHLLWLLLLRLPARPCQSTLCKLWSAMLEDLDGVICRMDDILIWNMMHVSEQFCFTFEELDLHWTVIVWVFVRNTPVLRTHCQCPGCPCWPREDKYYWTFSNKCSSTTGVHEHGKPTGKVRP